MYNKKRINLIIIILTSAAILLMVLSFLNNPVYKNTNSNGISYTDESKDKSPELKNNNQIYNISGVPVLYYHSIRPTEDNELILSPEKLKKQLNFLKSEGYTSLSLSEFSNYILNNTPVPPKSFLITFDDGYMDNYYYAFPILKELNMKATIFCITFKLDGTYYLSAEALKEMSDYGIDIECHTVNHDDLSSLSYDDQLTTLKNSKSYLENLLNKKIYAIAYPFGNINNETTKAVEEAGYTLGFLTSTGLAKSSDNPLQLKRIYISSEYDLDTFKDLFYNAVNSWTNIY